MSIKILPNHVAVLLPSVRKAAAYLARPGFPGLIEVQESKELMERPVFVDRVEIPFDSQFRRLIDPIGLSEILVPSKELSFSLAGRLIAMKDLL